MGKPLRVLIVEDSEIDSLILTEVLRKGGFEPIGKRVETLEALIAALDEEIWDLIVIDYTLPTFTGIDVLKLVRQRGLDIPSLIVSGTIDDETAVAAMKAGAHDYIMKPNLARLAPAVERELREAKDRREFRLATDKLDRQHGLLRQIIDAAPNPISVRDREGRYLLVNLMMATLYNVAAEEIVGKTDSELGISPVKMANPLQNEREVLNTGRTVFIPEEKWTLPSGETRFFQTTRNPLADERGVMTRKLYVSVDITQRKRSEEALRRSQAQLRAFAGRLQAAREEERTQIAREIHDELGGALTALKIDFSLMGRMLTKVRDNALRDSVQVRMDDMTKLVDATMRTMRRIATGLRPGVLDDLGLVAALEWQLTDFQKRTDIRCEFTSSCESVNLDEIRATALFRIVQEALTNVARHARATEVRIRLRAAANAILLEVEDNGVGIKEEGIQSAKSLGLLGMRERAISCGARVTITGRPGEGTTVAVETPPARRGVQDQEADG